MPPADPGHRNHWVSPPATSSTYYLSAVTHSFILRLLVILETDDRYADGVEVATGPTMGQRTLCVVVDGYVATTFVDVRTGIAVFIARNQDAGQRNGQLLCPAQRVQDEA